MDFSPVATVPVTATLHTLSIGDPGAGQARPGRAGLELGYGEEGCLLLLLTFYWGVVVGAQCWLQIALQELGMGSALILGPGWW